MAIPITVPRLGWSAEEGVFGGWLKPDGAPVRAGEALFRLESEKANVDVECLDDGLLRLDSDSPREGETVVVGAVIGHLVRPGEEAPTRTPGKLPSPLPSTAEAARSVVPAIITGRARQASSPRARRVARELGIDLSVIQGSGKGGRVRERDVLATLNTSVPAVVSTIPVTSTRRTIAARMIESRSSTAPVTLMATADATNLVNLREQFKTAAQSGGDPVPAFTDFLLKLAARAIEKHPLLNSSWTDERIVVHSGIHIGIAVDVEAGLVVPILRDVASLGLKQVVARSRDLIERARLHQLSPADMQGGTFTITNLGAFGIESFTPLLHSPQCAILGVGRIQRHPVVFGEAIVIREQMPLSLTFDHRIVDGAPAARFLQTLISGIENPGPWLLS